jgi:hypothetical protein
MTPARLLAVIVAAFALAMFGTFTDRPGITLAGWVVIVGAALVAWVQHWREVTR